MQVSKDNEGRSIFIVEIIQFPLKFLSSVQPTIQRYSTGKIVLKTLKKHGLVEFCAQSPDF